jgi:hypothetical protein
VSFYVSTAIFFLLHCDEWDRVVALPRHKFVTGATLLQLIIWYFLLHADVNIHASNRQIWYRHPNVRPEMAKFKIFRENVNMDFYFVGITFWSIKLNIYVFRSNNKTLNARLFTRKGYNGMPLHVMEQPPRFFELASRASDACSLFLD